MDELGFDAAIDYKAEDVRRGAARALPGGDRHLLRQRRRRDPRRRADAAWRAARAIVICGAISQYNATEAVQGPSNYLSLLVSRRVA